MADITSPSGCGCKSNIEQTLPEMGVKVMLAGNMGEDAVRVLNNSGIEVLRRCSGDVKAAGSTYDDNFPPYRTCHMALFQYGQFYYVLLLSELSFPG